MTIVANKRDIFTIGITLSSMYFEIWFGWVGFMILWRTQK